MDALDRQILAELQQDGRLTVTELAERVGLSVSPCHRRLRELERSGAISGYRAHLEPLVLGLSFEALVFVTMKAPTGTPSRVRAGGGRGGARPGRAAAVR